jgi:hypothetical protein
VSHERQLKLRLEDKLLLQCVRIHRSSTEFETVKELAGGNINWTYVIDKALAHGVMPLLYRSLCAFCQDSVPEAAFDRLRKLYSANAQRNLLLTSELAKILDLFATSAISVVPLKGPVLAFSAYNNLSLRQFRDLDILIPKADVLAAKKLLVSMGYRPYPEMTQTQEMAHLQSFHARVFVPESQTYTLDLHWAVTRPDQYLSVGLEYFCGRLMWMAFAGTKIRTLSTEDLMLVLCVHGSKHGWTRLQWICDVAELVQAAPTLDWQQLMQKARDLGVLEAVTVPLLLARNLVGASVPEHVFVAIKTDPKLKSITALVTQRFLYDQSVLVRRCQDIVIEMRMKKRVLDRFLYFLHQLSIVLRPNSVDRAVIALPITLSFLYYMMRPFRLIITYALLPLSRRIKYESGRYGMAAAKRIPKETL